MRLQDTIQQVYDFTKTGAYVGIGGGLVGKLLVGTEMHGIVLISTNATFLGCAATAVAGYAVYRLAARIAEIIFTKNRDTEQQSLMLTSLLIFGGYHFVVVLTGFNPIGIIAITILGMTFQKRGEILQETLIEPYCKKGIYNYLKFVLPKDLPEHTFVWNEPPRRPNGGEQIYIPNQMHHEDPQPPDEDSSAERSF